MTIKENHSDSGYSLGIKEIRMFLTAPKQRWKVTLTSFCVVIGIGILLVIFASPSPVYESKAELLITQPVDPNEGGSPDSWNEHPFNRQIFPGMFVPNSMTLNTLASLATSNDLLDRVIKDISLSDSITGEPFTVDRLAAMISSLIQYDYSEGANLPLLDLSVRGHNPVQIRDIADKWADLFIQENKDLFSSETARSYDKWQELVSASENELRQLEEESLAYARENSENLLREELFLLEQSLEEVSARINVLKEEAIRWKIRQEVMGEELEKLDEFRTIQTRIPIEMLDSNLLSRLEENESETYAVDNQSLELTIKEQRISDVWSRIKQEYVLAIAERKAYEAAAEQSQSLIDTIKTSIADTSAELAVVSLQTNRFNQKISRLLTGELPYLQSLLTEATIAKEGQTVHLRIVEEPATPTEPISGSVSVLRAILVIVLLASIVAIMAAMLAQLIFPRNGSVEISKS